MVDVVGVEPVTPHLVRLTVAGELPGVDANADMSRFNALLERSSRNRKQLMESEL